jgi:glycosyltransferase involved in cell wall biosynthesis
MTRPTTDLVRDRAVREHAGRAGTAPSVPSGRRPRIAMVSTFPPTQCGLATFAQALAGGFDDVGADVDVVRVVAADQKRIRGVAGNWITDPATTPWPTDPAGAAATARVLNGYDVVILQHEYGIYGGPDGEHVLGLMRRLDVPVVSVLHTVLSRPTSRQHRILSQVIRESAAVVTMTRTARDRAVHTYGAAQARVAVVPHGAAEALVAPRAPVAPSPFGGGAPVVLTWGLLGRGKGIEWGIRAMAALQDLHPAPVYVVAGRTHPRLPHTDGEGYRDELVGLAGDLGIASSVVFDDRYLDAAALHTLVRSADVVLLPYDSVEQVTSGVLTEAVAAGKPVISTRFPHALELLGDGTGLLVERADPAGIAAALRRVLTDADLAQDMAHKAHGLAGGLTWRAVATEYLALCAWAARPSSHRAGRAGHSVRSGHDKVAVG